MAASRAFLCRQVYKTSRLLNGKLDKLCLHRNFGRSTSSCQLADSATETGVVEDIVIPKKKTWNKEAVLEALASTVNRDPTAANYRFQDDTYLAPRTAGESKLFSLSLESGKNAAKYIINTYPKYFQKDFAEPHIPCFMPESLEPHIEELSEAALTERIQLRKVKAAVDMYDQLVQAGTTVSLDVTNNLLDLICLYADRDPVREDTPVEMTEDVDTSDDPKKRRGTPKIWKENNNAERIFSLLPEPSQRSYSALIRGMAKHGAYSKAFKTYTDMLNNRLNADVHTFNALITVVPELHEKYNERWDLIVDLLKQMANQKVQPNLMTFNSVLKVLRRCGGLSRTQVFRVVGEMKALGIAPSLATYSHVLHMFYKMGATSVLQDVLKEVSGKSFVAQDPDDATFFLTAIRICEEHKDIKLAYKVHSLLGFGENWRLLGSLYMQGVYYGQFFKLICQMEHIDTVLKWYRELIPSAYHPNSYGIRHLLQALDTDSRLDLIPEIWRDMKRFGHDNPDLVSEVLSLMAREKQSQEVQESFAECALDMKTLYTKQNSFGRVLSWTASSLSSITVILLAAQKNQEAWQMLMLFKANNKVPSAELLTKFLTSIKESNDAQRAVELVQISASHCLSVTPKLMERVLEEFELSEDQKNALSEHTASTDSD